MKTKQDTGAWPHPSIEQEKQLLDKPVQNFSSNNTCILLSALTLLRSTTVASMELMTSASPARHDKHQQKYTHKRGSAAV